MKNHEAKILERKNNSEGVTLVIKIKFGVVSGCGAVSQLSERLQATETSGEI